ncbi:shikimate dehydrogenase [Thiogranum longum]|uniref:Shikimate dehydrogenase (NADP(+)) n=1 Tax=Thiogranum longum TaxID=1537524 RepID=A0A4R1H521_9GAMM|nr:shikimate dehydrogenase [Thiogranum longum]TCK16804.1 shikimate dehydrogenase [Thiogranum longum]
MTEADNVDRYAVMGNPIAHSKSPQIHRMFAEQTGQALRYDALLVPEDGFAEAVTNFLYRNDGKGLNVTVPFKQQAWELADRLSERAEPAGAVNTLMFRDGTLYGDNTDGAGLVRDLTRNHGVELKDKRILMLGAGGAARGVMLPLLEQQPASLHIANRTVLRARELVERFEEFGDLSASGFDAIHGNFDVIINATAAGLGGEVPPLPDNVIDKHTLCYDMMYSSEPTAFVRHCIEHNAAKALDGLGMLVEQAAESFRLWRGVMPDTLPVIEALRNS